MKAAPLIAIGILAALAIGGSLVMRPRGLRNRNPVNIEYNPANRWVGQTGTDGRFSTFAAHPEGEYVYGMRAAAVILKNYASRYGLNTVAGIISRFAPAHENPTDAYIVNVAREVGVSPTAAIDVHNSATLTRMLSGMVKQEVGSRFARQVPQAQIARGVALA